MRLDEIRQTIPEDILDAFADFKLELEGAMGWEAELNQTSSNSAQIKASWIDEDGRTASPIKEVKALAHDYFLLSEPVDCFLIDEQEFGSMYYMIVEWEDMRLNEIDVGPSGLDLGVYKVFVNTAGDPPDSWATNAMEYDSVEEATEAAKDLFMRWTAVKTWRVMDPDQHTVYAEGP